MNVSGGKHFLKAHDQGSRKHLFLDFFFPLLFTCVAFVLNLSESLVIELQRKARLLPLLIQLEFKLHYISAIDPCTADIWAGIINDVKAIL